MPLTIEVPFLIAQEFDETALQAGVPPQDQATVLLFIADALLDSGKQTTEFQSAVRAYLSARSVDSAHLSNVVNELIGLCFNGQTDALESSRSLNGNLDQSIAERLQNWRSTGVRPQAPALGKTLQPEEALPQTSPEADAFMDAAWKIYDERLKSKLEPEFLGQVVAIHPASGDYEVARSSPKAWKPLRQRHPGEFIAVLDIGFVSDHNALSRRASGVLKRAKA